MIAGVILAAGASRRFGSPKQLAEYRGRPLLEHVVRAATASDSLEQVVVVLGRDADEVTRRVRLGRAVPVVCSDWADGISASIRCGLRAVNEAEVAVLLLGDTPDLNPGVIDAVIDALRPEVLAARATYHDRPGHPVAVRRQLFGDLSALAGDRGAQAVLERADVRLVECSALSSGADIDTTGELRDAESKH